MWQLLAGLLVGGAAGVLRHSLPNPNRLKLEEYRIFIEDTSRYSDRRQTVSNIYVAVNTIVISAAAVLLANAHAQSGANVQDPLVLALLLALSVVGVAASIVWWRLVCRYERIIAARLEELRNLEATIAGSHEMYRRMDKAFCGEVPSFSNLEKVLPVVFMALDSFLFCFVLYLLKLAVLTTPPPPIT